LHDTDAFGVIFFADQFKIVHDAYEALLEKFGFGFPVLLKNGRYFMPIVHAESDYKAPLSVGDALHITIKVVHIGRTSFAFAYVIRRGKAIVGTAKTVHVAIHPKTGKKTLLPALLRRALNKYVDTHRNPN